MTTYVEGPFVRWTAVSFGGVEMTVSLLISPPVIIPNMNLSGVAGEATGDTNEEKVAKYRKVWTGETSGDTLDATSISILSSPAPTPGLVYFEAANLASDTAVIVVCDTDSSFPIPNRILFPLFVSGETCT